MSYETLFARPGGRTSRGRFASALITLLAAAVFYAVLVKGRTGHWCLVTLLFPAFVLHARRLHDMGRTAWLLLAPGALFAAAVWLNLLSHAARPDLPVIQIALAVLAGFALWGLVGEGQAEANRFGSPRT